MKRILTSLVSAATILALTALPAMGQTAPAPPPGSVAPGAPGPADQPAARAPIPQQEKVIDGPVKKVDPVAKTVQVGWLLGFLSTTLEVTDGTQIAVEGAKASLQDIREGDEVKASYEARDGKYVAKSIEATHGEAVRKGAGTTSRSPASPASPQMMEPKELAAPPSGGPASQ
ncbi:MAG TPA: hypothetical protein VLT62_15130 [Candidatus Methylomirabilis sp.]|nr:hypothetical protein [Candidatus Methylomirabilis sp.]